MTVTTDASAPATGDAAWTIDATHEIYCNEFFRLRRDECSLRREPDVRTNWFVLELPDCVSVVPITADGRIVLVEQYRHGVGEWVLECPGGSVDPDDLNPAAAARRELFEETGFRAAELIALGSNAREPGSQSARVHTFLARDCRRAGDSLPENFEDLRLRIVTREQLAALITGGANFDTATLASLMCVLAAGTRVTNGIP